MTGVTFFATVYAPFDALRTQFQCIKPGEGFSKEECRKMAYKITEDCIACGACIPECPEEAIAEGDPVYTIDPEKCDECGSCADVCPVDCCIPEEES